MITLSLHLYNIICMFYNFNCFHRFLYFFY
uniref:RNA polymerase I specific transcription initiation factor n=1 Tax=Myoviridae sp. ctNQV2 TaxID=2827683 RepID=A0A8S5RZE4_9CAUD|nr:MAG TPA: RNA polymerase I specific transcription initiation factor [Myoviridae sp. ctNQV2]